MMTDGFALGHKARSEKSDIAMRLQNLSDAELNPIIDNTRYSGMRKVISYFDRTTLRERIVAEDILRFRKEGRAQGHTDKEINNVYGVLLGAGKIY